LPNPKKVKLDFKAAPAAIAFELSIKPLPSEVLKELYLDSLEVTITQAAINLGISKRTLFMLVNGHIGISAKIALRLSK